MHVAALRLYTTACFHSINQPLRDLGRTKPHPFATTVFFLTDAIKRLRAVGAATDEAAPDGETGSPRVLWRGMKNVQATMEFAARGGSELAPMSTTTDPVVAVAYGQSPDSLLFKIIIKNFMSCGADISFLSCFPSEREYVFPPLTFLQPTGRPVEEVRIVPANGDAQSGAGDSEDPPVVFRVIEVEPVI